ncbi:MAG TPA: hypothetical protein VIN35_07115 [Hydrogenophaga sp.]
MTVRRSGAAEHPPMGDQRRVIGTMAVPAAIVLKNYPARPSRRA